uniref:Thioredoxin domain-containing protein n=1 Tax=Mycena chlorophos TaxID=658473 RepID=A0ABQ0M6W6_MYCCL|nr:predicted protein [Mycena chlorophos]
MPIEHISSLAQLGPKLSGNRASVIDFWATWCGPCHQIAPTYEALSKRAEFKDVQFFKCDTDAAQDVAQHYGITAMPTFVFLKGSTKVDMVRGADRAGLESALRRLATSAGGSSSSSFQGKGQTLGGPTAPTDLSHSATAAFNKTTAQFTALNPQLQTLLMLVAGYAFFWYMS